MSEEIFKFKCGPNGLETTVDAVGAAFIVEKRRQGFYLSYTKGSFRKNGKEPPKYAMLKKHTRGPDGKDDQEDLRLNRVLLTHANGGIPPKGNVDHRDNDTLNNCLDNLRDATDSENTLNRPKLRYFNGKPCLSQFIGVSRVSRKSGYAWTAYYKGKYLGTFLTEGEAAVARDRAVIAAGDIFSKLNLPRETYE